MTIPAPRRRRHQRAPGDQRRLHTPRPGGERGVAIDEPQLERLVEVVAASNVDCALVTTHRFAIWANPQQRALIPQDVRLLQRGCDGRQSRRWAGAAQGVAAVRAAHLRVG